MTTITMKEFKIYKDREGNPTFENQKIGSRWDANEGKFFPITYTHVLWVAVEYDRKLEYFLSKVADNEATFVSTEVCRHCSQHTYRCIVNGNPFTWIVSSQVKMPAWYNPMRAAGNLDDNKLSSAWE
jgi:hypothetical protein